MFLCRKTENHNEDYGEFFKIIFHYENKSKLSNMLIMLSNKYNLIFGEKMSASSVGETVAKIELYQLWLQNFKPHKYIAVCGKEGAYYRCQGVDGIDIYMKEEDFASYVLIKEAPRYVFSKDIYKFNRFKSRLCLDSRVYKVAYGFVEQMSAIRGGLEPIHEIWVERLGMPIEEPYGRDLEVQEELRSYLPKNHAFYNE